MKKLFIAYDGSPCSDRILKELKNAGLPPELDATVVTVADVWLPADPENAEPIFPDTISKSVREARARAVQALEASRALAEWAGARLLKLFPKWRVRTCAIADSPSWGIIKESISCKADLIAIGSHGRSAVVRFFLGSVAQRVASEAYCSVRISRLNEDRDHDGLRILVGVDGSEDSQAAIRKVAGRPWPADTDFRVVAVVDPNLQTAVAWPAFHPDRWTNVKSPSTDDWVGRMVEHSAQTLRDAGLNPCTDIFDGSPKEVLLRQAEDWKADCIFVGARGLNHGDRIFLGSCAAAIAARAHCSVEIVR